MESQFSKTYPNIAYWVEACGWIEIGWDEYSDPFIKAFDEGGTVWEGAEEYETVDEALQALEIELAERLQQSGIQSADPNPEQNGCHARK